VNRGCLFGLALLLLTSAPATAPAAEPALVWSSPETIAGALISDIDCPTTELCVAVDQNGNAITTSNPRGPVRIWNSAEVVTSAAKLNAVSCASIENCAAVGPNGLLLKSTDPTGGASAWTEEEIAGISSLIDISCGGETCAAIDGSRQIVLWGGGSGGTRILEVNGGAFAPAAVDCPTSFFCVVIGSEPRNVGGGFMEQENALITIADPLDATPSFTHAFMSERTFFTALSCPSMLFCMGVDQEGNASSMTEPQTVGWNSNPIDPGRGLVDISCPSEWFCGALDDASQALTASPRWIPEVWDSAAVPANGLSSLSCPSERLCLAAGGNQIAVGSPAPALVSQEEPSGATPDQASPIQQSAQMSPAPRHPSVQMTGSRQIFVKNGRAMIPVSCISFNSCTGGAKLTIIPRKRSEAHDLAEGRVARFKIAESIFTIPPNRSKRLTVRLNRRGRALLRQMEGVSVQLSVDGWSADQRLKLREGITLRWAGGVTRRLQTHAFQAENHTIS